MEESKADFVDFITNNFSGLITHKISIEVHTYIRMYVHDTVNVNTECSLKLFINRENFVDTWP